MTGAAVGGIVLAPNAMPASAADAGKSAKKVRIGVVGGGFGCAFYWHEHPNCVVQAVSDLREDRRKALAETYRCGNVYPSLEELIKDKDVDAVAVFTGAPDHVPHALKCLKAGKHVISAVPACQTVEEAEELLSAVKKTGLTYMMAETSYYNQSVISARDWYRKGKFGNIYYMEAQYHHMAGPAELQQLAWWNGKPTWRYGGSPMGYPTHCLGRALGVTGGRAKTVSCLGTRTYVNPGDEEMHTNNRYHNPFTNESALFQTVDGSMLRVLIFWRGSSPSNESGAWYGEKMSFFGPNPIGSPTYLITRSAGQTELDDAGFPQQLAQHEEYSPPQWWATDMLPEPMRHGGGHDGSQPFLTHEFIDALIHDRKPAVDIYEALAFTVPGIVAHESALQGGKQLRIPSFDPKS